MQFKCIVERIIEKDGLQLFALTGHPGIYELPKDSPLFAKLAASHRLQEPVMVTCDADLNILDVT